MSDHRRPCAVTQGDPSGIGPEITLQAWLQRDQAGVPPFFVLTDPNFLRRSAQGLGWSVPIEAVAPELALQVFERALPVVPLRSPVSAQPARPDLATAASTLESIETAVRLVREDSAAAVVTNPIAKHVLYAGGLRASGSHGISRSAGGFAGRGRAASRDDAVERGPRRRARHGPHAAARRPRSAHDGADRRERRGSSARDLRERFGIPLPRLAVAGLNPHAGESGSLGGEDEAVIAPAVAQLQAEGIDASGPFPADTMFHAAARENYDVALAMYHDQALIPIKTIAFDDAVNVTLGLPFVRTSPDHGTAFDIAGKGVARPDSLIAALAARGSAWGGGAAACAMSAIDALPPLREVVRAHGLDAKKSLGQNFLFDLNLTSRIARAAGPLEGATVVEVGPGPGGLTRAILAAGREKVIAIERDARCLPALAEIAAHYPGRLGRRRSRCAGVRSAPAHRRQSGADRFKPALQRRHRAADRLARGRGLAALVAFAHADVPARGRGAHRGR